MEVKKVADVILDLWQMDGYRCENPPMYRNDHQLSRYEVRLILSVDNNYYPIELFKKIPVWSFSSTWNTPQTLIAHTIDDIIVVVSETHVYGIQEGEIKFVEKIKKV